MPGEQDPSKFEAFKQGVIERFEGIKQSFNNAKAVGEIAAVGVGATLGLVGGVALEQTSTEPARAANVPEATASDLQQDCVDAALDEPEFNTNGRTAVMTAPGSKTEQLTATVANFEAMPDECSSLVSRATPEVFFKMQRPNNHKRFITTKPQEVLRDDLGYNINPPIGDSGGHGSSWVMTEPLNPPRKGWTVDRKFLYKCTPGRRITKFFAVFELGANSAVDGHSLGQKSYTVPGKVIFNPEYEINGGLIKEC